MLSTSLIAICSAGCLAFAGGVLPGAAGAGDGSISGYAVSNIEYELDATMDANIQTVTFNVAPVPPAAALVEARMDGRAYPCTMSGAVASCPTGGDIALEHIDSLTVVANG